MPNLQKAKKRTSYQKDYLFDKVFYIFFREKKIRMTDSVMISMPFYVFYFSIFFSVAVLFFENIFFFRASTNFLQIIRKHRKPIG